MGVKIRIEHVRKVAVKKKVDLTNSNKENTLKLHELIK